MLAVAVVLEDAVRADVEAEVVSEAAVVAGRRHADWVLVDLEHVGAGGRVAAVEDVLAAEGVGVSVVVPGFDTVEQVVLRLVDAVDRGHTGPGGRVAAGSAAIGRGEQVAAGGPDEVVDVADAGRVDRDLRARRVRVVAAAVLGLYAQR